MDLLILFNLLIFIQLFIKGTWVQILHRKGGDKLLYQKVRYEPVDVNIFQ